MEEGDISEVTAGDGLTGGGETGSVEISHAEDATLLPFAHHIPPFLTNVELEDFATSSSSPTVVVSDSILAPASGFIHVIFSATQKLDVIGIPDPPYVQTRRCIADYGVGIDQTSIMQYSVTSSVTETDVWFAGLYVPSKCVTGSTVFEVDPGWHKIHLLTRVAYAIDSGARSRLEDISLTTVYFQYDSESVQGAMLMSQGGFERPQPGRSGR
jgi:hypothetical protein